MSNFNALILLGNSGIGKDTLYSGLSKLHKGLQNIKFSYGLKEVLATGFRVPLSFLNGTDEKPHWREQTLAIDSFWTALDIMKACYYGAEAAGLSDKIIKETLDNIHEFPVFTDVRTLRELEAIKEVYNPYILHIFHIDVPPKEADNNISVLELYATNRVYRNNTIESMLTSVDLLLTSAGVFSKLNKKPTLFIYAEQELASKDTTSAYEPFQDILDTLTGVFCETFSIDEEYAKDKADFMFMELADESPRLALTSVTETSHMVWFNGLIPYLDEFRTMANLMLVVKPDTNIITQSFFSIFEISYV
jgi:hypothetical protein